MLTNNKQQCIICIMVYKSNYLNYESHINRRKIAPQITFHPSSFVVQSAPHTHYTPWQGVHQSSSAIVQILLLTAKRQIQIITMWFSLLGAVLM